MSVLRKLLLTKIEKEQGDIKSYMEALEKGSFKDLFNYGIAQDKRGFLLVDPLKDPGALYCGGMGSGKSIAMKFTLMTHLLANSKNTIYLLYDGLKGMGDYRILFGLNKNVAYAINDPAKIVPIIDMVHAEMMARKEAFAEVRANGIVDYEQIMKDKDPNFPGIARIVMAMEEFHSIPNSEYVKFQYQVDNPDTVAGKMKELMRVGRSYGLTLIAATQRAVSDDFPSTLKAGISQMMAFRVSNPSDISAMNISHADTIAAGNPGRCAYSGGYIQFPYMTDEVGGWLLKKYYKPLEAKTLKYSLADYQTAFSGEGNSGMVLIKPFAELLSTSKQYSHLDIAFRFLKMFNFKVEHQTNKAFICNFIAERGGKKYVGLVLTSSTANLSDKMIQSFKESADRFKADGLIVLSIDKQLNSTMLTPKFKETTREVLIIDNEDLSKIAGVLDNQDKLGEEFENMLKALPLAQKEEPKIEAKVESKEFDDEDDDLDQDMLAAMKNRLAKK